MSQSPSINPLNPSAVDTRSVDRVAAASGVGGGAGEPFASRVVWALMAVVGLLFIGLFWEVIVRGARAAADPDWAHIAAAPVVAVAYIAGNRTRLSELPARLCWPGLAVLFLGLFSYLWWVFPGRNDMFRGYSLILTLFGLVLFAFGPARMRVLWFPILYLVFAVKIPDSIWEQVAFKLTIVAAAGSEIMLEVFSKLLDFYITKEGQSFTMMWTDGQGRLVQESFNIANACSGLRALMTFIALGVAMAFLWDRTWWQRLIMMASAIPVALGVNIARVTSLGLLNLVNPELAKGQSHIAVGMLWLIPGLVVFLGIGKVLDMMLVEPEGDPPLAKQYPASASSPVGDDAARSGVGGVLALLPAALGGAVLAFLVGSVYLLTLNGVTANPMIPAFGPALSYAAAIVALVLAIGGVFVMRSRVSTIVGGLTLLVGAMLVTAVGFQSAVQATQLALIKQPVEMRHGFLLLPRELGVAEDGSGPKWVFVRDEEPLDKNIEDELGTDQYITRRYRDTTWPEGQNGGIVSVHLAYYTGMIDTVPHVPDRCWVAGGITPTDAETFAVQLDVEDVDPSVDGVQIATQMSDPVDGKQVVTLPSTEVPLRTFAGINGENGREIRAIYFFVANGGFYASANDVRLLGFDPRDKYSYYCKVDVTFPGLEDKTLSKERTAELLADLLPEIMAVMPDWQDVREGRWPAEAGAFAAAGSSSSGEASEGSDTDLE